MNAPADRRGSVPALECRRIERRFGGLVALTGVDLRIERGEIFGLVGPNGSGKTTLTNAITGFYPPQTGQILLEGRDITGMAPHAVARLGVARTFQNLALFNGMTVLAIEIALGISFARDEGLRYTHRELLTPLVAAAIAQRPASELGPRFDALGVCWGPYRTLEAALADDPRRVAGNPIVAAVAHPSGQTYPTPGAAATLRPGERLQPPRAPRLGEHTDAVLAELLGLSDGQIGRLHDQGRIAGPPSA